jgi:hypothetical protein
VSRIWSWLEREKLISRARAGRAAKVTLLYDDGLGQPYEHPYDRDDHYFQLPYSFWGDGWHNKLDLAELAVLLVAMSFPKKRFELRQERVPDWYGISTSTWQKGVQGLVRHDVLLRSHDEREAPLAPDGFTIINVYELTGPFSLAKRRPRKRKRSGRRASSANQRKKR